MCISVSPGEYLVLDDDGHWLVRRECEVLEIVWRQCVGEISKDCTAATQSWFVLQNGR